MPQEKTRRVTSIRARCLQGRRSASAAATCEQRRVTHVWGIGPPAFRLDRVTPSRCVRSGRSYKSDEPRTEKNFYKGCSRPMDYMSETLKQIVTVVTAEMRPHEPFQPASTINLLLFHGQRIWESARCLQSASSLEDRRTITEDLVYLSNLVPELANQERAAMNTLRFLLAIFANIVWNFGRPVFAVAPPWDSRRIPWHWFVHLHRALKPRLQCLELWRGSRGLPQSLGGAFSPRETLLWLPTPQATRQKRERRRRLSLLY